MGENQEIGEYWDHLKVFGNSVYVRNVKHVLDIKCPVHSSLLTVDVNMWKLARVSSIAVDAVPLGNKPEDGGMEKNEGYEVLVEQNGVVSRRTIRLNAGDDIGGRVDITKTERVRQQWTGNPGITREAYDARKAEGYFFVPLDDERGEGHCRSCHHLCQYEHDGRRGMEIGCNEPTCGHWIGCPGC